MVTEAEWNAIPVGSQLLLRLRGAEQKVLVRAAYEAALLCQGLVSWEESNDFDGFVGNAGGLIWYGIHPDDVRTKRLAMDLLRAPWPEQARQEAYAVRAAANACLASWNFGSGKAAAELVRGYAGSAVECAETSIAETLRTRDGLATALAAAGQQTALAIRAAIPWDLVDDAQMRRRAAREA